MQYQFQRAGSYQAHISQSDNHSGRCPSRTPDGGGKNLQNHIRTHTLLEALQAPLFTAYREGQPWNENHLRPCPLLDNPEALVDAVERSGAHSTDLQSPEDVHDLATKCEGPARAWAETADELWACSGH